MRCPAGHEMVVDSTFRFDHEEGDTPRDTESLRLFEAMGIELGATVELWTCELCDYAVATFKHDADAS